MFLFARLAAAAILAVALVSLAMQFDASHAVLDRRSVPATVWLMAGYFTILTNAAVAAMMLGAATGFPPGPRLAAAMTLAMVVVGLVYHTLLAGLRQLEGWPWWADQGLHSAMPLLTLAWWLAFAPRSLAREDLPALLIWPAVYAAYALVRGAMTGFWAYPFLDADDLGWGRVGLNVTFMVAGFAAGGLGIVQLARASRR